MWYKCLDCGHLFEEGEQYREDCGEYWGFSCSEETSGCPLCGGEYEETVPCAMCGSEHLDDELFGGVCEECIDACRNDFDFCYKITAREKTEIEINSLLASLFDAPTIEQILVEYIKERIPDIDCSPYIDGDMVSFGETLAEEVERNECKKK